MDASRLTDDSQKTSKANPARASGGGEGSSLSRLTIGGGAVALLLINLVGGLFAREQQRAIIDKAVEIYDTAFVSSNYIHRAQVSFQHFVDDRLRASDPWEIAATNAQLGDVLDELDVVNERAPSERARDEGQAVRARIKALADASESGAQMQARLAGVQRAMEALDRRTSAIGLTARDHIDTFSTRNDLILLGSIATSVMLAGLTLALLRHAVARSTMARMTQLANYDPLTSLPNRTLFGVQLELAFSDLRRENQPFALLSLDLDRFKYVNDTLGHHTGDRLLVEVARRIEESLRSSDMVARFGGDEFVVMQTPALRLVEVGALAEKLIERISRPYTIDGHQVLIGASVGVALAPQNGETAEELLRHSDVALYKAKAEGKGRFKFFTPEMNDLMQARRIMEIDLRAAVEEGRLDVYFQPLVSIATGRISASEALVRWTHATRGPISPADFIPLAEETGLVVAIGEHVLRTACRAAASWSGGVRVAVNLSSVQFRAGDLPFRIALILQETGLDARRLELKITESILIEDKDRVMQMLTALRGLGVRIALDDFGTGYSSLSYLSSFPFDKIKIDKSFVRNVANRPESAAIVRAILTLAETLEMATTAEGVEAVEELEWLRAHGCDQAQGFLFSRAVPARDFRAILSSGDAELSEAAA